MRLKLEIVHERWPIAGAFTIARGSKTEAAVVVAAVSDGKAVGRGECVPYARYGETIESVTAALEAMRAGLADGQFDRLTLAAAMPAGAARNALDCALWDYEAKRDGIRAWQRIGAAEPQALLTAYTLSLGDPQAMEAAARGAASRPLLKIKLGADGDAERLAAVRAAAPDSMLIVDANEGWNAGNLARNLEACAASGVRLVEQPLRSDADEALREWAGPVAICADESVHDRATLDQLAGKYTAVNIKLDKTGGLTEALAMKREAEAHGFAVMVGCMLATSLAMAPAVLLAQGAAYVDLDGPLLLARDRPGGLRYDGSYVAPPDPALWG